MNVAFDPWIPVVDLKGKKALVSLKDVFSKGIKYSDLAVRPHERVAVMRLLICVAHAAMDGPKDVKEWKQLPKNLPDAASDYLEKWKDSFELFHKTRPWLQVAKLEIIPGNKKDEEEWLSLNKICFTKASGNNTTLFDQQSNGREETKYTPEEIALNLITFQNYFVAGGKASSRRWGIHEMKNPPNPKGGPCAGKSILFTFIKSDNLFRSITLNLNTYNDLKYVYYENSDWVGMPIWEMPIKSSNDKKAIENATLTHLGRLVPQTRILRINNDCRSILLGAGFLYPKYQDDKNTFYPDVYSTMTINHDEERVLLCAKPNKAIWRELHAITVKTKDEASNSRGPLCFKNIPDNDEFDIVVNAMVTNPSQAAEITDLIESIYRIPHQLTSEGGRRLYEEEVKVAEQIEGRMSWAIGKYREEVDEGWQGRLKSAGASKSELKNKLTFKAKQYYWTSVETNLSLLFQYIELLGADDIEEYRKKWSSMLWSKAKEAYKIACGRETPRQMRAFALGWQILNRKEKESDESKEVGNAVSR